MHDINDFTFLLLNYDFFFNMRIISSIDIVEFDLIMHKNDKKKKGLFYMLVYIEYEKFKHKGVHRTRFNRF